MPYEIDHVSLWAGLRRGLLVVLAVTAGAGLTTFGGLSIMAPHYTSEVQLEINPITTGSIPGSTGKASRDAAAPPIDEEALHAHVRALKATGLLRQVADELQLGSRREFSVQGDAAGLEDARAGESGEEGLLARVDRALEVTAQDGRFISIRFTSADPQLAADFANRLAETYRSSLVSAAVRNAANTAPLAAHISARASPSGVRTFPKRGPYALLAMAAAWLLGMAWIVKREVGTGGGPAGEKAHRSKSQQSTGAAAPDAPDLVRGEASPRTTLPDAQDAWFHRVSSITQVAQRLLARSALQNGVRSLIAGDAPARVAREAIALVTEIMGARRQVVLVEWSPDGCALFGSLGLPPKLGITDLLEGRASFESVIARLPGSKAHFLPAGTGVTDPAAALDPDRINLVLDALDEVYDHIVIAAGSKDARALFGVLEGRFDAGIALHEAGDRGSVEQAAPGRFLGFDVIDIDIIRYERSALTAALPRRFPLARPRRAA
jgi:succinoglycan biosynthesis transport protein ExoP